MGNFFNLLLDTDAFGRGIADVKHGIISALFGFLYYIWTLLARITDWLQVGVEMLAGGGKEAFGTDIVSVIVQNRAVQSIFWNLVSVCTALMVFFTIIKIIMDQYDSKAKGGNPYKQVFTMFKGMLVYFFITAFVMISLYASGIIFNALKNATGGGSQNVSAVIWQQMAYDANRLRGTRKSSTEYDTDDKYYTRLLADMSDLYAKTYAKDETAEGNKKYKGWDGNKVVVMEVKPSDLAGMGVSSIPYDDEIYGWGIQQDDGSVVPMNVSPMEEEVSWSEGTIYDETMWKEGGWGDADFATNGQYDPSRGGWSSQTGGYVAAGFDNPIMSVVRADIGVAVDARFQPVYYVQKGFPLKLKKPEHMQSDVNVQVVGNGFLASLQATYYGYDNPSGQPAGYGYTKLEGSGADKVSIDISGGITFGASGFSAGFDISTFSVAFESILVEMYLSTYVGLLTDALISAMADTSIIFPLGIGLYGVEVISGTSLVPELVNPLLDACFNPIREAGINMKNPVVVSSSGAIGIKILRPMSFQQFIAFWLGENNPLAMKIFPEDVDKAGKDGYIDAMGGGTVAVETVKDPVTGKDLIWKGKDEGGTIVGDYPEGHPWAGVEIGKSGGKVYKNPATGEWISPKTNVITGDKWWDVNNNGQVDLGVLGQLTTLHVGSPASTWGNGRPSVEDAGNYGNQNSLYPTTDPETGETIPGGGQTLLNDALNEYSEKGRDLSAQIQEQSKWLVYDLMLDQFEKTNIDSALLAPGSENPGSLMDNICRYLFNASLLEEVRENDAAYNDLDYPAEGATATGLILDLITEQAKLKAAIGAATRTASFRNVVVGNRPGILAEPGIMNGSNTLYTPMAVAGGGTGGFVLDVHPVVGANNKLYLARTIDREAYGVVDNLKTFADSNKLQMGTVDFDKYIAQFTRELVANASAENNEREDVEMAAAGVMERLYDAYGYGSNLPANSAFTGISFAEGSEYYGEMKVRTPDNSIDLGDALSNAGLQSAEEEELFITEESVAAANAATLTGAATQAETEWNNDTITFVNLQDNDNKQTALADWVTLTKGIDLRKMKLQITKFGAISSYAYKNGAVGSNPGELTPPEGTTVAHTADYIDHLFLQDLNSTPGTVTLLGTAGTSGGDGSAIKEASKAGSGSVSEPGYNKDNTQGADFPIVTEVFGVPHYMNIKTVINCYDYMKMDWIMGFIAILVTLGVYMNFTFGLIQRLLNLAVLYLISPLSIAFYPFDEGAKFKNNFVQPFYKEVTASYAIVLSLNMFFVVFPVVKDAVVTVIGAQNPVLGLFFGVLATISLISMLPKIRTSIQDVLGAGGMDDKSLGDAFKAAKSSAGSAVSTVAGAVKGAKAVGDKVGKVGSFGAKLGRRIATNMADPAKAAANKEKFLARASEKALIKEVGKDAYNKMDDKTKAAARVTHAEKINESAEKAYAGSQRAKQVAGKIVGGVALAGATALTGGGALVAAGGAMIAKKVGAPLVQKAGDAIGKTTFGKVAGEYLLDEKSVVGKSIFGKMYRRPEAREAENKEIESRVAKHIEAKEDGGSGIPNKQVGMAISKERDARAAQAEIDRLRRGGALPDDPAVQAQERRKKDAEDARDNALDEAAAHGFKGDKDDIAKAANSGNPQDWLKLAAAKTDRYAAAAARQNDEIAKSGFAGSYAKEKAEQVTREIGMLKGDDLKAQVAEIMSKNKDNPQQMILELRKTAGAEKLADAMESSMGGAGGPNGAGANMALFSGVVAGATKELSDSLGKTTEKLSADMEKLGRQFDAGTKSMIFTAGNPAYSGSAAGAILPRISRDLAQAEKDGASDDRMIEMLRGAFMSLQGAFKTDTKTSEHDKTAATSHINDMIGMLMERKSANESYEKTSVAAQRSAAAAFDLAGKAPKNPTTPQGQ